MTWSLDDITNLYKKTFYTKDDASIALVAAITILSRAQSVPVWLFLIGPSSSGKSELVDCFSKVPFVTEISDLTSNTFLSGFSRGGGREASLLKQLGTNFTVIMKDFTTILSKPEETQSSVIAQMREIYDGKFIKATGTGERLDWFGKATFIMAATEAIFKLQDKFSDMGTRATNYVLLPQDRKETTRRALRNNSKLMAAREHLKDVFAEFVMGYVDNMPEELPELDPLLTEKIVDVADFSSICRSVVVRDYKGAKSLALSAEMPMRIAKQLMMTAQMFTLMGKGVLAKNLEDCIFKMALDSIPKQRRIVLEALAKYRRVNISGVSDLINYPPSRTGEWIEDLFTFGVCTREVIAKKQYWVLKPEYRKIMIEFLGVEPVEKDLIGTADVMFNGNYQDVSYEVVESTKQEEEEQKKIFDDL